MSIRTGVVSVSFDTLRIRNMDRKERQLEMLLAFVMHCYRPILKPSSSSNPISILLFDCTFAPATAIYCLFIVLCMLPFRRIKLYIFGTILVFEVILVTQTTLKITKMN